MPDNNILLGIIGGSGLYHMPGLTDVEERHLGTPFGAPSDPILVGSLHGQRVAFLARHGRGHRLSPSEVNYRANIWALKLLGVPRILSISACGSLRDDYAPGHIVIPDQIYDNTKGLRARTFFGEGLVAHVSVAEPFCPHLSPLTAQAVKATGATVHQGGAFVTIEGPRFSTKAESHAYRKLGFSLVGMTASPEAFLAREAEMCYTCLAHVTDYDVWHVSEQPVTVEMVIRVLNENTAHAQTAIVNLVEALARGGPATCSCSSALQDAILTDRARIPADLKERMRLLTGKYLK
jgi:5'-methylthioadenosine phosphorylase